jgi:hypothetical protein
MKLACVSGMLLLSTFGLLGLDLVLSQCCCGCQLMLCIMCLYLAATNLKPACCLGYCAGMRNVCGRR